MVFFPVHYFHFAMFMRACICVCLFFCCHCVSDFIYYHYVVNPPVFAAYSAWFLNLSFSTVCSILLNCTHTRTHKKALANAIVQSIFNNYCSIMINPLNVDKKTCSIKLRFFLLSNMCNIHWNAMKLYQLFPLTVRSATRKCSYLQNGVIRS